MQDAGFADGVVRANSRPFRHALFPHAIDKLNGMLTVAFPVMVLLLLTGASLADVDAVRRRGTTERGQSGNRHLRFSMLD